MTNASELLEGTTQRPHDFTGRIVNGQRTCRFCCCMQTEAIAIGPTCAQPLSDTERQVTQLEAQLAEVREALGKVQSYHKGEKPYDFHRLPDDQRQNEAFDAWQVIACEIDALLTQSKEPKA